MSFFTTSYLPSSLFPATNLTFLDLESARSDDNDNRKHQNFLRLLQHAVSLKVRILPLTWEPAFEKLGPDGATGTVNQNFLNSQVTFAFKRFKTEVTDPRLSEMQFRDQQYDAMITELTILSCPAIQDNPNIVVFTGLCFELSPMAEEVWPVLVFTKSNQGDMATFLIKNDRLDPGLLLQICGEIAKGIHILHECGVVHGDIKPGNVLVSQDLEQDAMAITLADFGFSRFAATDEDPVRVTKSEPWEAPEWSHREFKLRDARMMDVYSFGLLCLWVFFKDETLTDWGFPLATVHTAFADNDSAVFEELQFKKRSGDFILELAEGLMEKDEGLSLETRSRLRRVLNLTLVNDPSKRASSMEDLIQILSDAQSNPEPEPTSSPTRVSNPQWHGSLQVENLFFHLESCDYRVHSFVAKSLAQMADSKGCDTCTHNAAYQLALCYTIGFGVDVSEDETKKWLNQSRKTRNDITAALQWIRGSNQKSNVLANLAKLGYRYDLPSRYNRDGIMANAIDYYQRTVLTREELFGPANFSTLRLKNILVNLLRWNNQNQEALDIALNMRKIADDLTLSDQIEIKTDLARLLADLDDTHQAAELEKEILEIYANGPESDHTERLDNQQHFITLLLQHGDYDKAVGLAEQTLRECLQELGPLHSSTRGARRSLAASYGASGQLERAVEVNEELVKIEEKFLTDKKPNPKLVEDISRMGVQCYRLGKQDYAHNCYMRVQELVQKTNSMAVPAVNAVNNCATELVRQGNLELAVTILRALLSESTKVLGPESQEAAMVMGNLAFIYALQEQWEQAEPLEREVVEIRRKVLGDSHHNTITAMGNLRETLLVQGKHGEAASIGREELSIIENSPRVSLSKRIDAAETVARSLESAGAFAEAIPFLEQETILKIGHTDNTTSGPLSAMVRAAICYIYSDNLASARELIVDVLLRIRDAPQENLEEFISQLLRLAQICLEKRYTPEAEQVLVGAFLLSQQTPSVSEDQKREVGAMVSRHLQNIGVEAAQYTFNPSTLIDQTARAEGKEYQPRSPVDGQTSIAHKD